eukprot:2957673-Alexandrium_andersonii.AAC.1
MYARDPRKKSKPQPASSYPKLPPASSIILDRSGRRWGAPRPHWPHRPHRRPRRPAWGMERTQARTRSTKQTSKHAFKQSSKQASEEAIKQA